MSIAIVYKKSKQCVMLCKNILLTIPSRIPRDSIVIALFIMATLVGFGLGVLAGEKNTSSRESILIAPQATSIPVSAIKDKKSGEVANVLDTPAIQNNQGKTVVASKNGGRYYLTSCSGAKRIHQENKVWFASASVARAKGYTPARHCFGI